MTTTTEEKTPTFSDAAGKQWPLVLTIGRVRAIKDELSVDICGGDPGMVLLKISNNMELLASILWSIVEHIADSRSVTPQQFAELLTGPTLDDAAIALREAIVLFSPSHQREAARALMAAQDKALTAASGKLVEWVGSEDWEAAAMAKVDELLSGPTSTASPAV